MRKVQNLPSLSLKWTISESIPGSWVASLRAALCVYSRFKRQGRCDWLAVSSYAEYSTVSYTIRTGFEQAFDRDANIEYAMLGLGVLEI